MTPRQIKPSRGEALGAGQRARRGFLLQALNSRYLPSDDKDRLWALAGRSRYGSLPGNPVQIFPFYIDGGTSKLCAHVGGKIYEGNLGATGGFVEAYEMSGTLTPPRGTPVPYKSILHYPIGSTVWDSDKPMLTRTTTGWRLSGHRTPTATFTAAAVNEGGGGGFTSTTTVKYIIRVYDSTTGTTSAHGVEVSVAAFDDADHVLLTFIDAVTTTALGTHLRIYRTNTSEPAAISYRVDGTGDGIALASVIAGYTFEDSTSNADAVIAGKVQADGVEGENAWAEYGGPPPHAKGGVIFQDHLVLYGIPDRPQDIIYSARGFTESFPVNFDGSYEYYLVMSTSKQDEVLTAKQAGPYLLVFCQSSIFRVTHLPTYAFAGFDRVVQDVIEDEHGVCGPYAADSFGIGEKESQYVVYCSRDHGPMLTNGVFVRNIVPRIDWENLVEKSRFEDIVVKNYSTMQEVWVFYTPKGGTANTRALVIDYSKESIYGLRVTRATVKGSTAWLGWGNDNEPRFYIADENGPWVYVQDSGAVDQQRNDDPSGKIQLRWHTPRLQPGGLGRKVFCRRVMVAGTSGAARDFDVKHYAHDADEEYEIIDTVRLGPGEKIDSYLANSTGIGQRTELSHLGFPGSSYDEDASTCCPCLDEMEYEIASAGRQARTRSA